MPSMVGVVPSMVGVVPCMVGVVPSYTVEYHAACTVWCGMQNQNIKTCGMKFRGQTLTSTGMSGPFNPPPPKKKWAQLVVDDQVSNLCTHRMALTWGPRYAQQVVRILNPPPAPAQSLTEGSQPGSPQSQMGEGCRRSTGPRHGSHKRCLSV